MTDIEYAKLKRIEEAIQAFDHQKLYESSINLYKALDYQSNKTERIEPNNFDGFIDSFNLPKNSINKEKALADQWKQIEFIFQVADSEITRIQSLFDTGEVDKNEYQSFLFFTIQLKEESYKRGDLVKITRELNVPFKMPVIVLFQYGTKLTLSIIDRRLHKKDTSKDVLEKVTLIKDIDIINPQRAHKEILKDLSLDELYKKHEFHSFVKLHEAWKATLNISELNKKFYKELAYWYFWALSVVDFPADELKDDKSRNPVNVIRLITRLIFVWFLKEKNLVPDELFNKRELDKILDYKDKTGSTYYKAILQNLFFATLNTEMNKDVKDKNKISRTFVKRNTGVPHFFRYGRLIKDKDKFASLMDNIPFLNGGLFECLDKRFKDSSDDVFIDGFTQQVKNEAFIKVPDFLFFSDIPRDIDLNETFHTKGKKYPVTGLIDILSRYKFTIEENTPVEEEVALDPELLGKVFENLLASYNEETETTARKLTGSFYTPREIVNYMVDESLITYLSNCLNHDSPDSGICMIKKENKNVRLHHLFSYTAEKPQFTIEEKDKLIDAIDNSKILDPACGSGAFPMGVLHKLVFILSKLDPNNRSWKQKQLDKAKRDKSLAEQMEDDKNREATIIEIDKRIEDIEKAFDENNNELDFARKLFLVENCIYGVDIQPVAIQISKLRFFIALIVDQKTENDNEPNRGIRPLPNLETKFVAANTLISIEKPQQLTLVNLDLEESISRKEAEIHAVRDKHFRARTPDTKEKYRIIDQKLRDELASLLEESGYSKDTTKKLALWNPYNQNNFAVFFDSEWMFGLNEGFDIVIGNPPYLSIAILPNKVISELVNHNYETFSRGADLYCLFYEKGLKLLNQNGILAYISSNRFCFTNYGDVLREYLSKRNILELINFNDVNVFESANVGSIVAIIQNAKPDSNPILIFEAKGEDAISKIPIEKKYSSKVYYQKEQWNFDENHIQKLKREIELKGIPFIKWKSITTNRGITTGANHIFIIGEDRKNELIHEDPASVEILRPVLRGANIKRYSIIQPNQYLVYTYSDINMQNYPAILNYLNVHRAELEEVYEAKHGQKKWYELRKCSYYDKFSMRKLVWTRLSNKNAFSISMNGEFTVDSSSFSVGENLEYLSAILNSNVVFFYFKLGSVIWGKDGIKWFGKYFDNIPIPKIKNEEQQPFDNLVIYILLINEKFRDSYSHRQIAKLFENVLDAMVYELYFGEEMKKAEVDILALVEKDLEEVKNLSTENAIATLYKKWQEPQNEVRNRLLLMATRCPETIGVIENSLARD